MTQFVAIKFFVLWNLCVFFLAKCAFRKFQSSLKNVWKINPTSTIFAKFFQITVVHICISLNTNDTTAILHKCLNLSWSCFCSTAGYWMITLWFCVLQVKKPKTIASSWFNGKFNFSDFFKITFMIFVNLKNRINHINKVKM